MICEIALLLMLDSSNSLTESDWAQQVRYTAEAIRSEEVLEAVERNGPIAMRAAAFSSGVSPLTEWVVLRTRDEALSYANALAAVHRPMWTYTDTAQAIDFGIAQMNETPCSEITQAIIDISTDGLSDNERLTGEARDRAQAVGIRINAIGVGERLNMENLRESTVTSDGFLLRAGTWAQYPAMFRRKIIMELASR